MTPANGTCETAADAARHYLTHGVYTTPVQKLGKKPWDFDRGRPRDEWERLRLNEPDIARLFPENSNVGIILGAPSGGVVDLDLDCPEARRAAPHLLPPTAMIGGRESAPGSHYFYVCDDPPAKASDKLHDPFIADRGDALLLELRSTGGQTVVAPSVYGADPENGSPRPERFIWKAHGEPARVSSEVLKTAHRATAAAALLGRYWPNGARHDAALALAGGLRRGGWLEEPTVRFMNAVCAAASDPERNDRIGCVRDTFAAGKDDKLTGWPKLIEYLGEGGKAIVDAVTAWLNVPTGPEVAFGNSAYNADSAPEWADPIPLSSPPAVPAYPVEVLPPWLRVWAESIATELQVPVDLPGGIAVGLIGGGIGRKVVVCPRPGFSEPTNVYVMSALPPGERKTQTFKKALGPILELERELVAASAADILEKESEQRIAEKRVKNLEEKIAKAEAADREPLKQELATARDELRECEVPAKPLLYTEDDTPEALKQELIRQGGRLMVATTELLFAQHREYHAAKSSMRSAAACNSGPVAPGRIAARISFPSSSRRHARRLSA